MFINSLRTFPLFILLLCFCGETFSTNLSSNVYENSYVSDSIWFPYSSPNRSTKQYSIGKAFDSFSDTKFFQLTHIGVPLAAAGLVLKERDKGFRSLRNEYIPNFSYKLDDYMQYSPAALMLGLKFAGVEGRSSWGRMLTADAFSAVICATVVNGLKYSIKTERPDGSKRNSFPSGHTTVAFMTATMLHKEYGETRSYWYSVFGYGVAMATGISRQFNNRHWVSDVMFGAGLGILSTELGYFLAELIFKDKGIVKDKKSFKSFNTNNKPSYISFGVGTTFFAKINSISINNYYNLSDGVSASLEGAYFFNKYIGVMGKWTAMNCRIQINDYIFKERLNTYAFQTGPQFSFPISDKWLVGAYADIGYCKVPKYNIIMDHLDKNSGAIWGFGTNITYLMHRRLGIRGTFDYVNLPTIKWPNALCRNAVTTYMSACFMF